VLLDLGAGIDEAVLRFAAAADDALVVLTPDPSALTDAYALIKLLSRRTRGRPARFVVNQVANPSEARVTSESLINACRSFLTVVPRSLGYIRRDPHVIDAIRRQSLLAARHPQTPAVIDIAALAQKLARGQAENALPAQAAIR
jgi:flagellar biosynthesis protein FlhG